MITSFVKTKTAFLLLPLLFCSPAADAFTSIRTKLGQQQSPGRTQHASARKAMADYTSAAVSLFNNMKTPASIIAGAMVPIGFLSPLQQLNVDTKDHQDGKFAMFLRYVYPIASVVALCSELISVMWATVAVNQLTETNIEAASSVWHLIQRDFSLPWVATNAHFVIGMMGFLWVISSRAYFLAGKGPAGASLAGLAFSSMLLTVSIVNRGVAAGGGGVGPGTTSMRYGSNILALFREYTVQLIKRACSIQSFGPLELGAVILFLFSAVNGMRIMVRDLGLLRKDESSSQS
jgi:hypothetical protein